MVQKPIIIKLEHGNSAQKSNEEVKIQRISSSISPYHFIRLIGVSDNKLTRELHVRTELRLIFVRHWIYRPICFG